VEPRLREVAEVGKIVDDSGGGESCRPRSPGDFFAAPPDTDSWALFGGWCASAAGCRNAAADNGIGGAA